MSQVASRAFDPTRSLAELDAMKIEIAEAADAILFATEHSLSRIAAYRAGEVAALAEVERALCAILGACAFQDLSGQRMAKLEGLLSGVELSSCDPLAHGPALGPDRLDQSTADALFATQTATSGT